MNLKIHLAGLLIVCSASLFAQLPDSISLKKPDGLQQKINSIKLPSIKADSLNGTISEISNDLDTLHPQHKIKDASSKIENAAGRLDPGQIIESKSSELQSKADSLINMSRLNEYNTRLDALRNRVSSKLDSMGKLKAPDPEALRSLGKFRDRLDSMRSFKGVENINVAEQKLQALENSATAKAAGITSAVNSKLDLFNQNGGKLGNVNLPGGNLSTGGNAILQTASPGPGLPSTSLPSLPGGNPGSALSTNLNMPGTVGPQIPRTEIPQLPKAEIAELGNIQKEVGSISGAAGEISAYQKDLKGIASGEIGSTDELSKDLEKKALEADVVKDVQKELLPAEEHKAMLEKWNSDPEYKKEMAVNLAKEAAVDHFAGHEKELMAGMDQLSQAKARVKDVEEAADIFGKRTNPMKDKPFIERLRPGVNLQVQWKQIVFLDINPYIGYRISGRWMAGIGWNERIGFSSDTYSFSEVDRVHGVRSFAQFKIKESNHVILAPELMSAYVPAHTVPAGESNKKWVPGLMAGYKREFRYSPKVLGTVQILYNLVAPAGQSPYVSRFNLLVGFEFPMKKRVFFRG